MLCWCSKLAEDVDFEKLASLTEGYSGADLSIVCRDAAKAPMQRMLKEARGKGLSGSDLANHLVSRREELLAARVTMEDLRTSKAKVMARMPRLCCCLMAREAWGGVWT